MVVMELKTATQVINFAIQLEENSRKLYQMLAEKYAEHKDLFLSLAKGNKKNKTWVQRTYYEVVSDALETGFSFGGLDVDGHLVEENLAEGGSLPDILKKALDTEDKIQEFYQNAALKSKSFLADVPRTFERMTKERDKRKKKLKSFFKR